MDTGQARTEVSTQPHPVLTTICSVASLWLLAEPSMALGVGAGTNRCQQFKAQTKLLSTLPTPTSAIDNYCSKALFGPHQNSSCHFLRTLQSPSRSSFVAKARHVPTQAARSRTGDSWVLPAAPRSRGRGGLILWRAL